MKNIATVNELVKYIINKLDRVKQRDIVVANDHFAVHLRSRYMLKTCVHSHLVTFVVDNAVITCWVSAVLFVVFLYM